MVNKYTREINQKERSILQREREQISAQLSKGNKIFLGMLLIIVIIGIPLALSQIKKGEPGLVILAFVVLFVYLGIVWNTKMKEGKEANKRLIRIKQAISNNVAEVFHCKATDMIELKEYEDEGAHYLFQVESDKILSVCGQDFYATKDFPNNDFEIVTIYGPDKYSVYFETYCYGQKLKPTKAIDAKTKWGWLEKYELPGYLEIFTGKLDNIEEIIKSRKIAGS